MEAWLHSKMVWQGPELLLLVYVLMRGVCHGDYRHSLDCLLRHRFDWRLRLFVSFAYAVGAMVYRSLVGGAVRMVRAYAVIVV